MKILIINPPPYKKKDYIREGRCMQTKSSWAALWMPLSLCYIAAVLRKNGHTIKLVDSIAEKLDNSKLVKIATDFNPDLVVLNTAIPSIEGDMNTANELKISLPAIRIAVVGMYPTLFGKEPLERFIHAEFAITDEPEWVVAVLADAIAGNKPLEEVRGLIFRKNGDIIINEKQNLSENNIDELPLPARDLLNNGAYRLPTNGKKFTLLSVGRGCSGNCIYCVANVYYGRRFRKRSPERVADEIEECINRYDISNFLFWGESFTTDYKYGEEICNEIIRRNLKISWSTTSRVDTLNQQLLDRMKRAGCILLGLGIESYDQNVLNNARKGITIEQIDRAVSMIRKAGISSMGHFMFGLPGDTREIAMKSIKYACMNVDYAQFYCAIPYPKTELGKFAADQNWIGDYDYSNFELTRSVMRNESLSSAEIRKIRDQAYRRFYLRPKMLIRALREVGSVRSFFSVLNFLNWIKPKNI